MRSSLSTVVLLALACACSEPATPEPGGAEGPRSDTAPRPRTVLLVSLDTMRPDRLEPYGGPAGNSPRVSELARDAVVFENARAPSPWTLPSHMTMLTGLDPVAHGVKNGGYVLSPAVTTLAERLDAAGFRTAAFTDGGFVAGFYGFDQGFDVYEDERAKDGPNGFARLLPDALDWIADLDPDDDAFVFVHTFDAHAPFDEGDPEVIARFRERAVGDGPRDHLLHRQGHFLQQRAQGVADYGRLEELLRDYDAGVYETDRGVGQLLDALRAAGRYDDALVIVTSDHGEAMLEHRLHVGHGLLLTDSVLRVPMIVKLPGGALAGTRNARLAGLTDVAPTVLAALGLPGDDELLWGEDLHAVARDDRRRRDWLFGVSQNTGNTMYVIREDRKYISPTGIEAKLAAKRHLQPTTPEVPELPRGKPYTTNDGVELFYDFNLDLLGIRAGLPVEEQLYDLVADPGERRNLVDDDAEWADRMRVFCMELYEQSAAVAARFVSEDDDDVPFDPHQEQVLQALGYMHTQNSDDRRELPRWRRDELLEPPVVADLTGLEAPDAVVHRLRLALREGRAVNPALRADLEHAIAQYAAWNREHQDFWQHVYWRFFELETLAQQAGIELPTHPVLKALVGGDGPEEEPPLVPLRPRRFGPDRDDDDGKPRDGNGQGGG